MEYIKKDETTLSVSKPVETIAETNDYKLDFLKQQELDILKQMNDFVAERKRELEEVRSLIAKCTELGIKTSLEVETEKEALIKIIK